MINLIKTEIQSTLRLSVNCPIWKKSTIVIILNKSNSLQMWWSSILCGKWWGPEAAAPFSPWQIRPWCYWWLISSKIKFLYWIARRPNSHAVKTDLWFLHWIICIHHAIFICHLNTFVYFKMFFKLLAILRYHYRTLDEKVQQSITTEKRFNRVSLQCESIIHASIIASFDVFSKEVSEHGRTTRNT